MDDNTIFTEKKAAEYLYISPYKLAAMRLRNAAPEYRHDNLRNRIIYTKKDLDAWIEKNDLEYRCNRAKQAMRENASKRNIRLNEAYGTRLYNETEAAEYFGILPQRLQNIMKITGIPETYYYNKQRIYYDQKTLDKYYKEHLKDILEQTEKKQELIDRPC